MELKYALNVHWPGKMHFVHFAVSHYIQKSGVGGTICQYVLVVINVQLVGDMTMTELLEQLTKKVSELETLRIDTIKRIGACEIELRISKRLKTRLDRELLVMRSDIKKLEELK